MPRKLAMLLTLSCILAASLLSQGLTTQASKDDWEEINFEFNSAVLSDGYPSLLRLADSLHKNTGYHVKVEGNTDNIGSERTNEKLGLARANTVRDFLVKYGANASQIDVSTKGKKDPKYPGFKPGYSKTDVARWMNRRVVLTVTDQNGKTVSDGGVAQAIQAIAPAVPAGPNCCDDILKRLDAISGLLNDLKTQNAGLRKELDDVKNEQANLENKVANLPKPLSEQQTASVVDARLEKARDPRFSVLGLNVGADNERNLTFTGAGRFFAPYKDHFAVQIQGEYMYFRNQKEGQADIGLVNRFGNIQAGLFASFKNVSLSGANNSGTIGQGAFIFDYLFDRGKIGFFGTKGFLNNAMISHASATFVDASGNTVIAPNLFTERYLRVVDQVGTQGTMGLWGRNYIEASAGILKTSLGSRAGVNAKFVFPVSRRLAVTVEGGNNVTMVGRENTGRAVIGLEFGNLIRPKDYLSSDRPVPMLVPRVRYEVLTRNVKTGVSQPVADAGPDQIGVPAGPITLNGSGSRDPNGEQLTYQWVQEGGPAVALSAANSPITTFTAAAGQSYSFRLTVRNTDAQQASARTRVTTTADPKVEIVAFFAQPNDIQAGSSSTLNWRVLNADTVTIDNGIGSVNPTNGTVTVSPPSTTTYRLTATNKSGSISSTAVVTVRPLPGPPAITFAYCNAVPATIVKGEAATIFYQATNADSVTFAPGGGATLATGGSFVVTPTDNTTYTLTARGPNGVAPVSCSVSVKVNPAGMPRIVKFSANPMTINQGGTSTLLWVVEGAKSVTIDQGIGTVDNAGGTVDVQPQVTTTYTLTAINDPAGPPVTQTATVTVIGIPSSSKPKITSFTATPPTIDLNTAAITSTLSCKADNASRVVVSGVGPVDASGNIVVSPTVTTTYVCVAVGNDPRDQASANVTVTVIPKAGPGTVLNTPCIVNVSFDTPNSGTTVCETVVRTTFIGYVVGGKTAPTLPVGFNTTSRNIASVVLAPTSQQVQVQVSELFGDYFFDYTVTDATGKTTTGVVDVRYVISHIPR